MSSKDYQKLTQLEHVKKAPDVWGAVNRIVPSTEYLYDSKSGTFEPFDLKYSPLFLKMADEIITNVADQRVLHPRQVRNCSITFDAETGTISVYNDGVGFPIEMHEEHGVYIPELVLCQFLAGSNFERSTAEAEVTGGKNGIGAKLTNAFSSEFLIETGDADRKLHYTQVSRDGMTVIEPPEIETFRKVSKDYRHGYTRITWTPDYVAIGYKTGYKPSLASTFNKILYTRACYLAVACGITTTYNDEVVACSTLEDLAVCVSKVPEADLIKTVVKHARHSWEVIVAVGEDAGFRQMSFVNSIVTTRGGTHIDWIVSQLVEPFKEQVKKITKSTRWNRQLFDRYLSVFMRGNVPNPQFNSQAKEQLAHPASFSDYTMTKKFPRDVWALVKPRVEALYLQKNVETETRTKGRIRAKKYERAAASGGAEAHKCSLLIPEGDSAENFISKGLTNKKANMGGYKYFGTFNIGGVPINVRTKTKVVEGGSGSRQFVRSKQLKDNERINALYDVLGLQYAHHYRKNKEGNKQFASLRYGQVIICTDQDTDGIGKIFGLLMNFFEFYWPALIERGYIKRLATPIIRCFPKNARKKVITFYREETYKEWCQQFASGQPEGYDPVYYKGLASHDKASMIDVFSKFHDEIYTYYSDDTSAELFDAYFAEDSEPRKVHLSTPVVPFTPNGNEISCSAYLNFEYKAFALEDINRHTPHMVDGLRPSARKVLYGSRRKFATSAKQVKVFQLGGYIAETVYYHHGSDSLNGTIVQMAQDFPGANIMPYLLPLGDFGGRGKGRAPKFAGCARYINTKLNRELVGALFPTADDCLLEYVHEDGERAEPTYFVPTLPTVLLETYGSIGTGWRAYVYARNLEAVVANVRGLIKGGKHKMVPMPAWTPKFTCVLEENNGVLEFRATYTWNARTCKLHVSELPPEIWHNKWKDKYEDHDVVDDIINNSSDDQIDITLTLKRGAIDTLRQKKEIGLDDTVVLERVFGLRHTIREYLNCIGIHGTLKEYSDHQSILLEWFDVRKQYYIARVARQSILVQWKIRMLENIVRYADHCTEYGLSNAKIDVANTRLDEAEYVRINKVHLENPAYTPIDELEAYILEDASFKYLLDLRDSDRFERPNALRREKLDALRREYDELVMDDPHFPGARIWLREIGDVERIVKKGLAEGWGGESKVRF